MPSIKIIKNPAANQADHHRKHAGVILNHIHSNTHHPTKQLIDDGVGMARKAVGERRGQTVVALDDIGVVPDQATPSGHGLGDRPGLKHHKLVCHSGPFNVLRSTQLQLKCTGHCRQLSGVGLGEGWARLHGLWDRHFYRKPVNQRYCDVFDGHNLLDLAIQPHAHGVTRHAALYDTLAQAPSRRDQDLVWVRRVR